MAAICYYLEEYNGKVLKLHMNISFFEINASLKL